MMKRCPITYEEITDGIYSKKGLNKLNPALDILNPLPFTNSELILESRKRMTKMSIQGVQPKLSARLSIKNSVFEIVNRHGIFILKPNPAYFQQVPENEDVTMKMAAVCGIDTPLHGLIYNKEGVLVYFIRRFDREGRIKRIHVEDFAQLAGMSRETKYNYSMEQVGKLIDQYCTFPIVEKFKLFRLTLFSYLVGNEDMHLKNFSIIHKDGIIELTPAYDLLNSTIVLSNPSEEMALPIKGKKSNFTRNIFLNYFGYEMLGLNKRIIINTEEQLRESFNHWLRLLEICFLSDELKSKYLDVLVNRRKILGWC